MNKNQYIFYLYSIQYISHVYKGIQYTAHSCK